MTGRVPEDTRYEIKFVAYETCLHRVLSWVKAHWAVFRSPYPDRWVNSIYFDSHDYFAFKENLSGASSRLKVRYRWYGDSNRPAPGVLELKCKRNYFGWKHHYLAASPVYEEGDRWPEIQRRIMAQIPDEGRMWMRHYPFPVFINQYYRRYFLSRDGRVRLTIDTRQNVWDQRYGTRPNFSRKVNLPKTLVMELKFDRREQQYASSIIQGVPIRVSRNSKYIIGVRSMKGMRG